MLNDALQSEEQGSQESQTNAWADWDLLKEWESLLSQDLFV